MYFEIFRDPSKMHIDTLGTSVLRGKRGPPRPSYPALPSLNAILEGIACQHIPTSSSISLPLKSITLADRMRIDRIDCKHVMNGAMAGRWSRGVSDDLSSCRSTVYSIDPLEWSIQIFWEKKKKADRSFRVSFLAKILLIFDDARMAMFLFRIYYYGGISKLEK